MLSIKVIVVLNILICGACATVICDENVIEIRKMCTINGYVSNSNSKEFVLDPSYNTSLITHVKFINSNVTAIPGLIFLELNYLHTLDVSDSQVSIIEPSAFMFGYNLRTLDLSRNYITRLPDSVFGGSDYLVEINLSQNRITNIGGSVFKNLNSLTKIDLSYNNINVLSSTAFPTFLPQLILDFNHIVKFSVSNLTQIDHIAFNNNQLKYLKIDCSVKSIKANNNFLSSINLSLNHSNLISLSLKNNSFKTFNGFKNFINLTYLDLSNNPISHTQNQKEAFANLKKLKTLILKSTSLSQFKIELFSELYDLEMLDISLNSISSIDFKLLSRLENLKHLKLNGNNLDSQTTFGELEYLFPDLRTIDISENNWSCETLISVLTRLKRLNVNMGNQYTNITKSGNNIRGIRCTMNKTELVTNSEPALERISNTSETINKLLNHFQYNNEILKTKLNEVLSKMENSERLVQPNYNTTNLMMAIEQLKEQFRIKLISENHGNDVEVKNQINKIQREIFDYMDNNFAQLYEIKVYLLCTIQLMANFIIIGIVIAVFLRFRRNNQDRYNNYNFDAINCSKSDQTETSVNLM